MKKKSLNQSETIRWLIFSWLPEFITLLYVIVRSIINPYFLNYFLITALFFSVFITIYTYLKAGLMVCSYFILVKINNNEKDDKKRLLTVKNVKRLNEKKAILDFEEIGNVDSAKELNGYKVKIRRDLLPEKSEDDFYVKDLFGLEVFSENNKIGEIVDVMETAAHNILIIEDIDTKKEIMIPLIDEFVTKIDFPNGKIEVTLIDGMRE